MWAGLRDAFVMNRIEWNVAEVAVYDFWNKIVEGTAASSFLSLPQMTLSGEASRHNARSTW